MNSQCFSLEHFADLILEINGELKNRMKATDISKSLIRWEKNCFSVEIK